MQRRSRTIWIGLGAASAALMLYAWEFSSHAIAHAAMVVLLAYAAAHDAKTRIIPNWVVASLASLRLAELGVLAVLDVRGALDASAASLAGAAAVLAVLLATAHLTERTMGSAGIGGGDMKLLGVLGFCFGWEAGLLITGLSCVLMLAHRLIPRLGKPTAGTFAFAPYIALATVAVAFLQAR
ncbi:MAG TPA: A24 family peptidase [Atopobiaceae bacterium]|nr:A24 family peptidase [Atopobiaceae bacterium]